MFIWLLFLGGAQAFSKGGHLVVDVIFVRFPRRMQLILMFVYYIVIAVFSGYLFVQRNAICHVTVDKTHVYGVFHPAGMG